MSKLLDQLIKLGQSLYLKVTELQQWVETKEHEELDHEKQDRELQ